MPGARSKKGFMMHFFLASPPTDCMATSCPHTRLKHEPENILKTKGRKRAFSKNEAENILKRKPVTRNRRNSQKS
jgi:hypothetical protein